MSSTPSTTKTVAAYADGIGTNGLFSLGKYRDIVLAVALFLLFDLGVLVLNFATSYQIGEDAHSINLAGRQRMLSQRSAKALLAVEAARQQGQTAPHALAELRDAVSLFDATLQGFAHGAIVPSGSGQPVYLKPAEGAAAVQALQQAQALWAPFLRALAPVLNGLASDADVQAASTYAQAHNLELLGLMNSLTTALEATASRRATTLRQVQTAGIVLALLNFAFILFKFLRRLRRLDAGREAVTRENREILASVREGLFLITPDFRLGSQVSQSAQGLFGRPLLPGDSFFALLAGMVDDKALQDAQDYVALLFAPHVKEALVQDINPLLEVHVLVTNGLGQAVPRTLAFRFNRVRAGKVVDHVLVTAQDISDRTLLQTQLQAERLRSQNELALLLDACQTDPALLRQFVARSEAGLLETNDLLGGGVQGRPAPRNPLGPALDQAARRIHALKGDAGALGLDSLVQQAHAFESALLQARSDNSGDGLRALSPPLEALMARMAALKSLADIQRDSRRSGTGLNAALTRLAMETASALGKRVAATVHLDQHGALAADVADLVREISTQLVRNAVVHGIEAPATRQASGKAAAGQLVVQLARNGTEWILRVRDDGRGLNASTLRQKLLDLGWYSALQLESFDDHQIVGHIFKPGFSTVEATTDAADGRAGIHAGRGVGLDVVQANVQRLGGRLTLASTPGQFTEIAIHFEM
ncbi:ATP-binding protein [Rhodoferax sp. WC2427]|uniref:ATP-binding protein n=1 Tax=Rhodoferax sp. WC2427 TaxID=3234144 RepID=UPI0034679CA3